MLRFHCRRVYFSLGKENPPQPPAAANIGAVETACKINGNGFFPLREAFSKRAGSSESPALFSKSATAFSVPERGEEAALTHHQLHVLSSRSAGPAGPSTHPKGEKGEKCSTTAGQEPSLVQKPPGSGAAAGMAGKAKDLGLTELGSKSSTPFRAQWG